MTEQEIADAALKAGDEMVSWTVQGMDLIVCTVGTLTVLARPKTRAEADEIVERINKARLKEA